MDGDDDDNGEKSSKSRDHVGDDEIAATTADTVDNDVPAAGNETDNPEKIQKGNTEENAAGSASIPTLKSIKTVSTGIFEIKDNPESMQDNTVEENTVRSTRTSRKSMYFLPPTNEFDADNPGDTQDNTLQNTITNVPLDEGAIENPKKIQVDDTVSDNAVSRTSIPFRMSMRDVPAGDETDHPERMQELVDRQSSRVIDVLQFVPPEAIKTVKLKKKSIRVRQRLHFKDKADVPIASKVIYLKQPEELLPHEVSPEVPPEEEEGPNAGETSSKKMKDPFLPRVPSLELEREDSPMHLLSFVDNVDQLLKETQDDKNIEEKVNHFLDKYRNEHLQRLKDAAKRHALNIQFGDMVRMLHTMGIPCHTNEDTVRLHGSHGRWDPDGTVVEYFSPMLRSFIPVNMRGRYRGSWSTDTCMKGVNISKLQPKRDAPEGFVVRGRHANIQQKYDEMSSVASDETHLDYLIEMQAFQAETLPVPIFYNMLHLGMQVANENLRILVQEEGYPPSNEIFGSQLQHAEQLHRKIQMYGALGLETMDSKRKGLGEYMPHWLKSRDEIIRDIMASKDAQRYDNLERKENEVKEREAMRQLQKQRQKSRQEFRPNAAKSWAERRETKVHPEKLKSTYSEYL